MQEKCKIVKVDDKDLSRGTGGLGSLWVKRYIVPENESFLAGYCKYDPGDRLIDYTYWYDEVMYILNGELRLSISYVPYLEKEEKVLKGGEMIYIPKSTRISHECHNAKPCRIVYFAVPAIAGVRVTE
jgi:ethanolamine utilization protein EutQ (cupin superfamily)